MTITIDPSPATADFGELIELAGMRAETAVQVWKSRRRAAGLGKDAYGGAMVVVRFEDRRLLNAMKRADLVSKGTYPGDWTLKRTWAYAGQEAGVAIAMADEVSGVLNAAFGDRAIASVHHWWS